MEKYIVEMQMDKQEKFYFIRENESGDIVYLPSKYLMHKKRSKISPNTIRRSAFALSYYLNFLDEKQLCLDDIYQMKYIEQHEHFTDFLIWLKAGMHSREDYLKLPNNETCNAYLKEVFRFYTFMEQENKHSESLKVLSDTQMIVRNSIGIRKVLNRKSFRGYLKEKGHQGKTIEQDKIVVLLQECANSRDQVLLLLLAETGFRIGELLGVRYAEDIDYEKHIIYVNFRDDNENGARAKNAELRRAKISDATFDILMFYIEDYKELIIGQEYLFINVSGDYVGKPFKGSGVYAMLRRLERKTGIKASPHMLRHYFANARRKDGWKLEMISQALGHRNIETTMKYLNITEDELIEVSDAFYNRHQAMYGVQNGETTYIFAKKDDPTRPYQYSMIQNQIMTMIRQEDIRDDNGEFLKFGTHIFRHCYGKKLTEMHVDDWMIAKLLGHTSIYSVHHYRKIGNKLMADETRAAREKMDMILLDIIEGWDDYEI